MGTATSPAAGMPSASEAESAKTGISRAVDITARLATSWLGLLAGYAGAVTAAIVAFQKSAEPLKEWPFWARIALVFSIPLIILAFHTIPTLIEQRRKKKLTEITGNLKSGYFRLAPREDQASFARADGKHEEILEWLEKSTAPILYLTGQS